MSFEKAKKFLEEKGFSDRILVFEESTATVPLAAKAVGVQEGEIAKTLSFYVGEEPILILTAGTARVDNRKFKDAFKKKPKMIPAGEVEAAVGHSPGGVCPFGAKEGIRIFLDQSLKAFEVVYPAAGDDHSAVRCPIPDLEKCLNMPPWVDVCKELQ